MRKRRLVEISFFMALNLIVASATAGIYRWVDENGRVRFSDRPPPEVEKSEEVTIRNQGPVSETPQVDRKQAQERLLEQYERERAEKKEKAAKKRKQMEEQKVKCDNAKTRLIEYQESGVLYERLPNQQRRYLTDQEREAAIAEARREIKKWCKS